MSDLVKTDPFDPPKGTWIIPVDGWGYLESIDGNLAPPMEIKIERDDADFSGIRGWTARVISEPHKYSGMSVEMTPRNTAWNGLVVAHISNDSEMVFNGMAESRHLDCSWL